MPSVIIHDRAPQFSADLTEMYELRARELGIGKDELDDDAVHHIAFSKGLVVAAGRSRPDGGEPGAWLAEHIVVKSDFEDPAQAERTIIMGLERSIVQRGARSLELQIDPQDIEEYKKLGFVAISSSRNRRYRDMHKNIGVEK
jgi:hypothetical protein